MVLLPPEYHPLRSYPAVVSLHDGLGPRRAIDWWAKEAARRGYIVIAPEYLAPGLPPDYRYSQREHAAVELAVRDARKRYAIDSDRIGLHGVMIGGQGALDIGLGHPDLFCAVASVSGVPAKFVYAYRKHSKYVPLYIAIGDLVPGNRETVFDGFAKPLITDAEDVTYVEYHYRGLEDLPEEAPTILDWIDKHRREPAPKAFEVSTARPCDARFWGVVVQEHQPARTIAPEAAEVPGTNINPAKVTYRTSNLSNLINISVAGVSRMDVWVSPRIIDFKRRMEVRINGHSYFKGLAKLDLAPMLTDLRYRGDRQQLFWMKVSTGRGG
jgi:dienelactone hydrolase